MTDINIAGAYLDRKQPDGGKTVISVIWNEIHNGVNVPFREWIRVS